jgi:D-inositol-3-phosphate glycosyltransferase
MERPTRVAFLSEHASPAALLGGVDAGGQNVYVDEVARHLARCGYMIDVFTRRDRASQSEILEWAPGVRIIHLEAGPVAPLSKDALWPYMPAFRDACLQFIEREEIHYDLVHGNFWMSGWVATELQQRLSIPATHIFHAMGATKRRHQGAQDTSDPARMEIERYIVQTIDSLIAPCPAEQEELLDVYGADEAKIDLIPLAVDTEMFRPIEHSEARQVIDQGEDDFLIVYVGRIVPRKDIRNIVRALALLKQQKSGYGIQHAATRVRLLIVGGETTQPDAEATPEIGVLRALAGELGVLDDIVFCGNQQQGRLRYYYSAADVVVTTPWYEPFGLTPLEAMSCGRPVIGSDVGGISYTISDEKTGFLIPPRDPAALADRLTFLLTHSATREQMGVAARQRVEQEFTWSTVAVRTAALYERLLAQQATSVPLSPTFIDDFFPMMNDVPGIRGGE